MATVTITLKKVPDLYLECESITPDKFAGKTAEQIAALPCSEGKSNYTLGQWFTIAGSAGATAAETMIVVNGRGTDKCKYIGAWMTAGEVVVNGTTDMFTGAWMEGGKLTIKGDVRSFSGLQMKGGEMIIEGRAWNYLAAAYRGDWRGMQGGLIRVKGDVGSDLATFMNGGTIIVEGNADIHIGTHAEGGTIIIKGKAHRRVGGQMVKGEIYVFKGCDVMMPGYKKIEETELEVDGEKHMFNVYIGDLGERHPKSKGQTVYGHIYTLKE